MANTHSLDLELTSSQYASIADGSQTGLDLSGDLTFEAWIKLEQQPSTVGDEMQIITKAESNGNQISYIFQVDNISTDNPLTLQISDDGTSDDTGHFVVWKSANISLTSHTGEWVHVAVSFDISTETPVFYLNGVSDTATKIQGTTLGASIFNSSAKFIIGAREVAGTPEEFYDGLIDEVRVWNDIRTGTEISDNYEKELAGTEAGLVGYWRFNNDYLDQTSNDNDLTASGSPTFSTDVPDFGVYELVMAVGEFTLTGIDTTFTKAYNMIASVGTFILTGFNAIFTKSGWSNDTKPSDTWTEDTKPSDSWNNDSK